MESLCSAHFSGGRPSEIGFALHGAGTRVFVRMSRCCGEAYLKYVEGGNPRRTLLSVKIATYGWELTKVPSAISTSLLAKVSIKF